MTKLTKLTPEQTASFPDRVREWTAIGLSCEPMDKLACVDAAIELYSAAKIPFPPRVVFVSSPFVGAFAASIAEGVWMKRRKSGGAVGVAVDDAVRGAVSVAVSGAVRVAVGVAVSVAVDGAVSGAVRVAVNDAVGGAVSGAVSGAVDVAVRGAVGDAVNGAVNDAVNGAVNGAVRGAVDVAVDVAVRDAVYGAVSVAVDDAVYGAVSVAVSDAVYDAVYGAVDGAVDYAVDDAVRDAVRGAVDVAVDYAVDDAVRDAVDGAVRGAKLSGWHYWYAGSLWAGFASWYATIKALAPSAQCRAGDAYEKSVRSGGYMWLNSDFVMICDRPAEIHRNERGALHNESGMAIQYRDGWGLWMIDGFRVTEQIVMRPDTITINQIKGEKNAEVRRIMRERFGEGRYLRETKAKVIDVDYEGARVGAAPRALMQDDERRRFLVGTDGSTGRVYFMEVPATVKTCRAAHEALCGFPEDRIVSKS